VTLSPDVASALAAARAAEKDQSLFYRTLAAAAEEAEDAPLAERLNGLHADEQHHLSRLTARLVEAGYGVDALPGTPPAVPALDGWEAVARAREVGEVARYRTLLALELDERTARMLREFLAAEERHAEELGGKWMGA
jgi:rubrerythrin